MPWSLSSLALAACLALSSFHQAAGAVNTPKLQTAASLYRASNAESGVDFHGNKLGARNTMPGPLPTIIASGEHPALKKQASNKGGRSCAAHKPTITKSTSSEPHRTTKPPLLDCTLIEPIPDEGRNSAACSCEGSTWPVLSTADAVSERCAYRTRPAHATNPNPTSDIETSSWTSNCVACTQTGPAINAAGVSCTKVPSCTPSPTMRVSASNNTIPIGDLNNANKGKDLRKKLYDGFTGKDGPCTGENACDSKIPLVFDGVPTVIGGEEKYLKVSFTVQESYYMDTSGLKEMLVAGIGTWQHMASLKCDDMHYTVQIDETKPGCGKAPVRRDLQPWLKSRTPICEMCISPPQEVCHYKATTCDAPNHFHVDKGVEGFGPYAELLDVDVDVEIEGSSGSGEFDCELFAEATEGILIAVTALFPEAAAVVGEAQVAEAEFLALCDKAKDIGSSVNEGD